MKVAVVGATGLVGQQMLKVLEETHFPVTTLIPVASERSIGIPVRFQGKDVPIVGIEEAIALHPDIALFSAGSDISRDFAPRFAEAGTVVIDNSSAWRMEKEVPLVVPEINMHTVKQAKIIANPNCSTIQMVMALAPLHKSFEIKRLVISTYQSVTGTGKEALDQLMDERSGKRGRKVYPYPIDMNCLPHCDVFLENDYTKEEMKLVHETRKILEDPSLRITATAVRVPVMGGHSESVNVEFEKPFEIQEVRRLLAETPGVVVQDNPAENEYPMPNLAGGKDEVFVGRIRRDESIENGLNLWIVSDNLRKGAATNAVQIALQLIKDKAMA